MSMDHTCIFPPLWTRSATPWTNRFERCVVGIDLNAHGCFVLVGD